MTIFHINLFFSSFQAESNSSLNEYNIEANNSAGQGVKCVWYNVPYDLRGVFMLVNEQRFAMTYVNPAKHEAPTYAVLI